MSVQTKTTYLQMFAPPVAKVQPPRADVTVVELTKPTIAQYRTLYRTVGEQYSWFDRLIMLDEQLASILADERVKVFVLQVNGTDAGYSELDCRSVGEIELAYFGLFPRFVGQGLGRFFLHWTLQQAWLFQPRRVWVHTCDLDHPAALANYLRAGLETYDERFVTQRTLAE
ncbi:hypothetical protein NA78x_003217 [Anatilimnocola sp. NA78]|uniref:hypothetical protein n=1 Tax=Anatilimnocola sp. NA78 TaxID=3415683 RepID=UPI003CE536E9